MEDGWIDQDENSIFNIDIGSTVLVKFKDGSDGTTIDSGETIGISYTRAGSKIATTDGIYSANDIKAWRAI
jgi:hypothetical protein